MQFFFLLFQGELRTQLIAEFYRVIPDDIQTAAFLGTTGCKSGHYGLASRRQRSTQNLYVLQAVFLGGQKVKRRPVVPQGKLPIRNVAGYISLDPVDPGGRLTQP